MGLAASGKVSGQGVERVVDRILGWKAEHLCHLDFRLASCSRKGHGKGKRYAVRREEEVAFLSRQGRVQVQGESAVPSYQRFPRRVWRSARLRSWVSLLRNDGGVGVCVSVSVSVSGGMGVDVGVGVGVGVAVGFRVDVGSGEGEVAWVDVGIGEAVGSGAAVVGVAVGSTVSVVVGTALLVGSEVAAGCGLPSYADSMTAVIRQRAVRNMPGHVGYRRPFGPKLL